MDQAETSEFYIIKNQGKVAAAARVQRVSENNVELCSLGVYRTERCKGMGQAIVNHIISKYMDSKVWAVTEIPFYFEKFGFAIQSDFPKALKVKLLRCLKELECADPKVMCYEKQE